MLLRRVTVEIEDLSAAFPGIFAEAAPDGSVEVVIPSYPLPEGWSKVSCEVLVVAPILYPDQVLDNFWAEPGIQTRSGGVLGNCMGQISRRNKVWSQYSWHWTTARWDRDCHNVATFIRSIDHFLRQQK